MKRFVGLAAMSGVALLIFSTCAWSVVAISWSDKLGPHSLNLTWVMIDQSDPLYAYEPYAWRYCLDGNPSDPRPIEIHMEYRSPIAFAIDGNYTGDDGEVYPVVLFDEKIYNETPYNWTDFHMHIEGGEFEWTQGEVINWNIYSDPSDVLYEMEVGGQPVYAHTGIFRDGIYLYDSDGATADMVVTKWPTPQPEPAALTALVMGLAGMLVLRKRR